MLCPNALASQVHRNEIDFGIGNIAVHTRRFSVVDYTRPAYIVGLGLVTRGPTRIAPYLNLLKPFSELIWGLVLLATLGLSVLVLVSMKYEVLFLEDDHERDLWMVMFYPTAILLRQGRCLC